MLEVEEGAEGEEEITLHRVTREPSSSQRKPPIQLIMEIQLEIQWEIQLENQIPSILSSILNSKDSSKLSMEGAINNSNKLQFHPDNRLPTAVPSKPQSQSRVPPWNPGRSLSRIHLGQLPSSQPSHPIGWVPRERSLSFLIFPHRHLPSSSSP